MGDTQVIRFSFTTFTTTTTLKFTQPQRFIFALLKINVCSSTTLKIRLKVKYMETTVDQR
jgi:hypothetical protein